ncbi:MAG: hypothetical protein IPO87_19075 [Flavobacteriales bacterium]|nr:hypothetical protein [Flavobacteriales bacterium]
MIAFHPDALFDFHTAAASVGNTSVHSFTGDGMLPGLLVFLLFFIALSVFMLIPNRGQRLYFVLVSVALLLIGVLLELQVHAILLFVPSPHGMLVSAYRNAFASKEPEESLWSREFLVVHRAVGLAVE